ncbi:hypothetical protein BE15_15970 [Sorangium cellulosum]|uniref:Uncharacterized protein n=1 Tax=Sorangium cellulosum TaxID=56 RepID=A0A150Q3V2_SORCE|nr:hypothetical protein BE15_15970 [Sorangium cellulosum]
MASHPGPKEPPPRARGVSPWRSAGTALDPSRWRQRPAPAARGASPVEGRACATWARTSAFGLGSDRQRSGSRGGAEIAIRSAVSERPRGAIDRGPPASAPHRGGW